MSAGVQPARAPSGLPPAVDPVLRAYLEAGSEAEVQRSLDALLGQAETVVREVHRRRRPGEWTSPSTSPPLEDVWGEVAVRLLERLNGLRAGADVAPIQRFRGFVAVVADSVWDAHLRQRCPRRTRLKNQLRYLLSGRTQHGGLAVWAGETGDWLCGFEEWRRDGRSPARTGRYLRLREDPRVAAAGALPDAQAADLSLVELVSALFRWIGGPVELEDLVSAVAVLRGIRDMPDRDLGAEAAPGHSWEAVADPAPPVATAAEARIYLEQLWAEVRQLPPRQCAALLLNLRDGQGRGIIALLPLQGIAGLRQIAEVLAMPAAAFAAIWNDLPLPDADIAGLLGCTRQQVINLRKSARERLARRMHLVDDKI